MGRAWLQISPWATEPAGMGRGKHNGGRRKNQLPSPFRYRFFFNKPNTSQRPLKKQVNVKKNPTQVRKGNTYSYLRVTTNGLWVVES